MDMIFVRYMEPKFENIIITRLSLEKALIRIISDGSI